MISAVLALLSVFTTPASATAQSQSYCDRVEEFPHILEFQDSRTLPDLLSKLLADDQISSEVAELKSNRSLVRYLLRHPDWIELGKMAEGADLQAALDYTRDGMLIIAAEVFPNGAPGMAALLTGTELHSSNIWTSGVPAGVFYDSTNTSRSFAGCKLSYIWRDPENLRLFMLRNASQITPSPKPPVEDIVKEVTNSRFDGDPLYEADKIFYDLKKRESLNTQSFDFEGCVYLHGSKGWISEWENFRESDRVNLAQLLSNVPTTKLHSGSNSEANLEQFVIGPLCDCRSYSSALSKVEKYKFELLGILRGEDDKLSGCLSRRSTL